MLMPLDHSLILMYFGSFPSEQKDVLKNIILHLPSLVKQTEVKKIASPYLTISMIHSCENRNMFTTAPKIFNCHVNSDLFWSLSAKTPHIFVMVRSNNSNNNDDDDDIGKIFSSHFFRAQLLRYLQRKILNPNLNKDSNGNRERNGKIVRWRI